MGEQSSLDTLVLDAMRLAERTLSCADKPSNMRDMNRLLAKGYSTRSILFL